MKVQNVPYISLGASNCDPLTHLLYAAQRRSWTFYKAIKFGWYGHYSMTQKFYAHSLDGKPPSDWQPLEEHLKNVAKMARR